MTTHVGLTPKWLARYARGLSNDVDRSRWALAELSAQAKSERVPDWAAIIGAECRRAPDTVEKWARTWEWCEDLRLDDGPLPLPYSFYECAAKHSDTLGDETLVDLLQTAEMSHATYEAFRAQLSTLAGRPGYNSGDFPAWVKQERRRIADWIDRADITRHAADCLMRADAELKDALEEEKVTA